MLVMKVLRISLVTFMLALACTGMQLRAISRDTRATMQSESQGNKNSADVIPGKAITKEQPKYPKEARKARLEGAVRVRITVDEKGKVIKAKAIDSDPALQEAAVKAALKWKFEPTLLYGKPVKVVGEITFNFSLQEK
jgi:TonB family protein